MRIHHSRTFEPSDTLVHKGIRTTTPARTLDDIAPRLDLATLAPRSANLKRLLGLYTPIDLSESELEAIFIDLCARHGIPRPVCQFSVPPYFADFVWHDVGLIVEADGRRAHEGWAARHEDMIKERFLKAQTGYELERFTYVEVVRQAAATAAAVIATRGRLRASRHRPATVP